MFDLDLTAWYSQSLSCGDIFPNHYPKLEKIHLCYKTESLKFYVKRAKTINNDTRQFMFRCQRQVKEEKKGKRREKPSCSLILLKKKKEKNPPLI